MLKHKLIHTLWFEKKYTIKMSIASRISFLIISILFALSCKNQEIKTEIDDPWDQVNDILGQIKAPEFKDTQYNILDFGAVADSTSNCLPAIIEAITKCNAEGGGKVLVPAGDYYVKGPIHLKSNVNLHLEEGATIHFSTDPADYLPVVLTRWEGMECYNYSPLIYALDQENIGVTGKGTFNGHAGNDAWWNWVEKPQFGWKEGMPAQGDDKSRPLLTEWNTNEVAVEERILGEGSYLRPNFIQPYRCKNIIIEGVTFKDSPMWIMHPVLSENITIQGVTVISHGPNSDGCDPEACKNVLIKDCYFDTGDDCIALKSGRNQDGRNIGRAIENVIIQGCTMKDGHGGVVIGSEVSGGARNIFAEDCVMDSPNLDRALRIKTNKVRGGTIENIYFRNVKVGEVKEAVVRVNMRYPMYSDPTQEYIPEIRNILVENVTSQKSKYGVLIDGYSDEHPVKNLVIKNCQFNGVSDGNKIEYTEGLFFEEYYLNGKLVNNGI